MTQAAKMFGKRLRQMRTDRGLTIEDLAHRAGLAGSTVYRFEAGKLALPRADTLQALAQVLGVSADYLLGSITVLDPQGSVQRELLIDLPIVAAGTTVRGVIAVPRMLLPTAVPHDHLAVAYADAAAPDMNEGDMLLVDRRDRDPGDGGVVVAEVDGEIVVREVYRAGELRLLLGKQGTRGRVPPEAILGRVVRIVQIRDLER